MELFVYNRSNKRPKATKENNTFFFFKKINILFSLTACLMRSKRHLFISELHGIFIKLAYHIYIYIILLIHLIKHIIHCKPSTIYYECIYIIKCINNLSPHSWTYCITKNINLYYYSQFYWLVGFVINMTHKGTLYRCRIRNNLIFFCYKTKNNIFLSIR